MVAPTLEVEAALHAEGARVVIGCDEVGRGAIAGPVAVGVAAITAAAGPVPDGLRDSKLLSEARRERIEPVARAWVSACAVGMATADEIDRIGIIPALGLAGTRALKALAVEGVGLDEAVVLLDGHHDWLTPALGTAGIVRARVKADRDCGSVAAASVIAKVARDRLMIEAHEDEPGYGWASNKGYASSTHLDAVRELGASRLHRVTWLHAATQVELTI